MFEENMLFIVVVGLGKIFMVVGKVVYVLVKGIVWLEEILCLVFNGKVVVEIVVRINV